MGSTAATWSLEGIGAGSVNSGRSAAGGCASSSVDAGHRRAVCSKMLAVLAPMLKNLRTSRTPSSSACAKSAHGRARRDPGRRPRRARPLALPRERSARMKPVKRRALTPHRGRSFAPDRRGVISVAQYPRRRAARGRRCSSQLGAPSVELGVRRLHLGEAELIRHRVSLLSKTREPQIFGQALMAFKSSRGARVQQHEFAKVEERARVEDFWNGVRCAAR